MSNRERSRAALLLAAVFLVGALMGGAVDRLLLFRSGRMYPKHAVHASSSRLLAKLDRELDLTDAQKEKVAEIVQRRSVRLDSVWKQVEPAMRREIDVADAEISAVLDPSQRPKFEEMKRKWRDRTRKALGRDGVPK